MADCVRCGYCCRTPCGFGEVDPDTGACRHLEPVNQMQFVCGIADEIRRDPSSAVSPAFGAGCCSSLCNRHRDAVVQYLSLRRL